MKVSLVQISSIPATLGKHSGPQARLCSQSLLIYCATDPIRKKVNINYGKLQNKLHLEPF